MTTSWIRLVPKSLVLVRDCTRLTIPNLRSNIWRRVAPPRAAGGDSSLKKTPPSPPPPPSPDLPTGPEVSRARARLHAAHNPQPTQQHLEACRAPAVGSRQLDVRRPAS